MSEDRNNGIGDPAVSDAYRDMATERAPASLNEAVLRNAAAHASKGYAHSMLWIRPLAYAATVVLSLAIVVQVVLPTNMDADIPAASVPPAADATEAMTEADLGFADAGGREQTASDGPIKPLRDQETREETKIEEFVVPPVADEDAPVVAAAPEVAAIEERLDDRHRQGGISEVVVQASRVPQQEPGEFEAAAMRSGVAIEEASGMAAARSVQAGDYAAADSVSALAEARACEPEDIESPETWAECIELLEESGRTDEAVAERALLSEAFPDFEWPAE